MRRSTLARSNYLLSEDFLNKLSSFYEKLSNQYIDELIEKLKKTSLPKSVLKKILTLGLIYIKIVKTVNNKMLNFILYT